MDLVQMILSFWGTPASLTGAIAANFGGMAIFPLLPFGASRATFQAMGDLPAFSIHDLCRAIPAWIS